MISEDETFEYLTFGGTFARVFRLFFDRFDVFMGISLVFFVPYAIFALTFVTGLITGASDFEDDFGDGQGPKIFFMTAVDLLLYELACVIGQGAISIAVAEIYIGRRPGWGTCLKRAWVAKWALVCSSMLIHGPLFLSSALPIFLVFWMAINSFSATSILFTALVVCACLFGATFWYSGLILSSPAIAVENFSSPIKGMKRSWELSTGSRCYVLSTMIGLFFGQKLVGSLFRNIFGGFVGGIMELLFTLFYLPLQGITQTVVYLNLRIGRESMNQQVLMGDLMNSEPRSARFRHDDPAESGYVPTESLDYRHVPLIDEDEIVHSKSESMANQLQVV